MIQWWLHKLSDFCYFLWLTKIYHKARKLCCQKEILWTCLLSGAASVASTTSCPWPLYCQNSAGESCQVQIIDHRVFCPSSCTASYSQNDRRRSGRNRRQILPSNISVMDVFTTTLISLLTISFIDASIRCELATYFGAECELPSSAFFTNTATTIALTTSMSTTPYSTTSTTRPPTTTSTTTTTTTEDPLLKCKINGLPSSEEEGKQTLDDLVK